MAEGFLIDEASAAAIKKLLDENSEGPPDPPRKKTRRPAPQGREWFLARITGWAAIGSTQARWKYAWAEIELVADDFRTKTGGRTGALTPPAGTPPTYALNLIEAFNISQATHTGTQGNSVNQGGAAYPAGFSLKPVGGGSGGVPANQVAVRMWFYAEVNGTVRYVFEYINADDGACV